MKKFYLLFTVFLFAVVSSLAQDLAGLIAEGDRAVKEFNNSAALAAYQKADKSFPDNWEVKWRISRAYVDIAEHMPEATSAEKEKQEGVYKKALDYANESVKLAPDKSVPYLRRAIANGKIALFKGVFSVAHVVNQVKADCEKAISLNNGGNEMQGIAHYVYARTHAKISEKWKPARSVLGLGWADIDIALDNFKKAESLHPKLMMIYVDHAHALIREDEYKDARKKLEKALECPVLDEDDHQRIEEAMKMLKEIKDK